MIRKLTDERVLILSLSRRQGVGYDCQLHPGLGEAFVGQPVPVIVQIEQTASQQRNRQNIDDQYAGCERKPGRPTKGKAAFTIFSAIIPCSDIRLHITYLLRQIQNQLREIFSAIA